MTLYLIDYRFVGTFYELKLKLGPDKVIQKLRRLLAELVKVLEGSHGEGALHLEVKKQNKNHLLNL